MEEYYGLRKKKFRSASIGVVLSGIMEEDWATYDTPYRKTMAFVWVDHYTNKTVQHAWLFRFSTKKNNKILIIQLLRHCKWKVHSPRQKSVPLDEKKQFSTVLREEKENLQKDHSANRFVMLFPEPSKCFYPWKDSWSIRPIPSLLMQLKQPLIITMLTQVRFNTLYYFLP